MSGLIVGLVLRTPITDAFTSEAKFITTVYADHAWEDGTHAHPAVETVARITGLSVRTVQRYVHGVLAEIQMLIPDGKGPRGTIQYRFPLEAREDGSVRLNLRGGDTLSPRQPDGGDRESGDTESGDTIVSPKQTIRPLIHEEEEKAPKAFRISSELQTELKDLGVFVSVWKDIDKRISDGWTETDLVALIDWMTSTRKDKPKAAQGLVARVREGTKAPQEYYLFSNRRVLGRWCPVMEQPDGDEPEEQQPDSEPTIEPEISIQPDETVTERIDGRMSVEQAWQAVQGQLQMEMPRASFDTWVRATQAVRFDGNVLSVRVINAYARDWLESRLQSTVERLLVGILNQSVVVKFVAVETEVV